MEATLTKKQEIIYNYISSYIENNGYPPSVREICKGLGFSSTATVHRYLIVLEEKGYIIKGSSKNRSVSLTRTTHTELVPDIGVVTAGQPITAIENIESNFPLQKGYFEGDDHFILSVRGDSMIDAGIENGDKIVVSTSLHWRNGDIIVALIDDEATVKRIYKENGHVRLQPENSHMEPIIVDNVVVQGKVVGLFRKL